MRPGIVIPSKKDFASVICPFGNALFYFKLSNLNTVNNIEEAKTHMNLLLEPPKEEE